MKIVNKISIYPVGTGVPYNEFVPTQFIYRTTLGGILKGLLSYKLIVSFTLALSVCAISCSKKQSSSSPVSNSTQGSDSPGKGSFLPGVNQTTGVCSSGSCCDKSG